MKYFSKSYIQEFTQDRSSQLSSTVSIMSITQLWLICSCLSKKTFFSTVERRIIWLITMLKIIHCAHAKSLKNPKRTNTNHHYYHHDVLSILKRSEILSSTFIPVLLQKTSLSTEKFLEFYNNNNQGCQILRLLHWVEYFVIIKLNKFVPNEILLIQHSIFEYTQKKLRLGHFTFRILKILRYSFNNQTQVLTQLSSWQPWQ